MPLYEFQCKNCGEILEKLMKVTDPTPGKCEICEKGPLVKLMSRTHFVLKGQGWYETDFKNSRKTTAAPATGKKEEVNQPSSGPEDTPESKPATDTKDSGSSKKPDPVGAKTKDL